MPKQRDSRVPTRVRACQSGRRIPFGKLPRCGPACRSHPKRFSKLALEPRLSTRAGLGLFNRSWPSIPHLSRSFELHQRGFSRSAINLREPPLQYRRQSRGPQNVEVLLRHWPVADQQVGQLMSLPKVVALQLKNYVVEDRIDSVTRSTRRTRTRHHRVSEIQVRHAWLKRILVAAA
jgi:hypothetical protein